MALLYTFLKPSSEFLACLQGGLWQTHKNLSFGDLQWAPYLARNLRALSSDPRYGTVSLHTSDTSCGMAIKMSTTQSRPWPQKTVPTVRRLISEMVLPTWRRATAWVFGLRCAGCRGLGRHPRTFPFIFFGPFAGSDRLADLDVGSIFKTILFSKYFRILIKIAESRVSSYARRAREAARPIWRRRHIIGSTSKHPRCPRVWSN